MRRDARNELAKEAMAAAKFTTASGHARANCPFCDERVGKADRKQCFSVHTVTGWYRCWRCGIAGRLDGMEDVEPVAPPPDGPAPGPPEGFTPLDELRDALSAEPARAYLRSRGLPEPVWFSANLGACLSGRFGGRVIAPVLSPEGSWLGWVGRAWVAKCPKPYFNAPGMSLGEVLYNHAALLVETDEPAYVVEGVFDALSLWPDSAALLGMPTDAQISAMAAARRPVVMVLDGDAWEIGWATAMRLRLEGQRAGSVRLPPKTDPDQVGRAWLAEEGRRSLEA